jgi:fermentation-respiration switch protein FrsA (DUF1100 family)
MKIRRVITWAVVFVVMLVIIVVTGASVFMLKYSLGPNPWRQDTEGSYRRLFEFYPETRPWVDSLRSINALRDTFVTMPTGERHHALYVWRGSRKTALVLHGWRGCSIDFLFLARMYERDFGYNVVVPDFHAHGQSEGEAIGMGWLDRKDMLHWMQLFKSDTMAVHGVSMGGATTMMMSAEEMPEGVKDVRFVDDCGYTSVWDEFTKEMRDRFGLPQFPLMYTGSLLCKLLYGWSFGEASALRQVARSPYPMLFIHGEEDRFVPTEMAYRLYDAKPSKKELWIVPGTAHALSYKNHTEGYKERVGAFLR